MADTARIANAEAQGRRLTAHLDPIIESYQPGDDFFEIASALVTAHADYLLALGPVGVLSLDGCPRCGGTVIADTGDNAVDATCAAGCGWTYRRLGT